VRRSERGFTLIEVLVAIVVLASRFFFVAQALARPQQTLRISQNLLKAGLIAEERLAETEIKLRESRKLSTSSQNGEEKFPGNRQFRWTQNISPYYGKGIEDQTRLNQVDILVEWNDGPARESQEKMSTILMNRPKEEPAP
jgi:type II secretion system protein I